MQEGRYGHDNAVSASAAVTAASSPHHSTDTDAAASYQNIHQTSNDGNLETENGNNTRENGNKNASNGSGYEALDLQEVEEARIRAQQPSVYTALRRDNGGYEALDPREVEEARRRAQQPSEYERLQ